MKFLIIDTTKLSAFIVAKNGNKNYIKIIPETKKHSEELLNSINDLVAETGLQLSDFDAIGAITGPGSFTGIRIGMSTVKAFVCAHGFKIMQANLFEVVAKTINEGTVILKNTNTTCYMAVIKKGKVASESIVDYDNLQNAIYKNVYYIAEEHLEEQLSYINLNKIDNYPNIICEYFEEQFNNNNFVDINSFCPYYMQLSQAERELKDKQNDK